MNRQVVGNGDVVAPSETVGAVTVTSTNSGGDEGKAIGEGSTAPSSGPVAAVPVAQPVHSLDILKVHTSSPVKALGKEPKWVEIELGVDGGTSETVIGPDMISNVTFSEGDQFRNGVQYEVATGELIPNLGEKSFFGHQ